MTPFKDAFQHAICIFNLHHFHCHGDSVQVRDAVAVIQFLMWLEKTVPEGNETELTAAEYVDKCRRWVGTGTADMKCLKPTI